MSIKEKPPDYFKSVKTSLQSILKHPDINTKKINDAVLYTSNKEYQNEKRKSMYNIIKKM